MFDDLPVTYTRLTEDSVFQPDRSIAKMKLAEFYLGKYGPFTERVPDDPNFSAELASRIERLRASLRTLPR